DRLLPQELPRAAPRRSRGAHRPALGLPCRGRRRVRARRHDPPRARRQGARRGAVGRERNRVIVEISGLEGSATHGVDASERDTPQSFLFDVTLDVPEPAEDAIEATVDYRAVRDLVRSVAGQRSYRLLESLAAATADALAAEFAVDAVTVRVRKPGIPWAERTAATASRRR